MNENTDPLAQLLKQFGEAQLAEISTHDLRASTVHLILATAFFTGATIGMAKLHNVPRTAYLRTLRIFLERRFGLNADHAKGMIESNARLYKRYVLVERIYNAGLLAATDWCKQDKVQGNELKLLLDKYPDLSMSGLNIEGTKEQKAAPVEVEVIAESKPVTTELVTPPPTRWGRTLLLLLLLIILISIGGAFIFEKQLLPYIPMLEPILDSAREFIERLSTTLLDALPQQLL